MNIIKISNPDFLGYINTIRHACRGIIVKNDKILLCYEKYEDQYLIPGGGVENNESLIECCKREILEETGIICFPKENYLDIEESFQSMKHINHYFICDITAETQEINLTENEKKLGLCFVWISIDEAINIFEKYEEYKNISLARFGLYRRELLAIKEYLKANNK